MPEMEAANPQGEEKESAAIQQIMELASSGDPQALPQIVEICKGLLAHNQEEEAEMGSPVKGSKPSFADKLAGAMKEQGGAE